MEFAQLRDAQPDAIRQAGKRWSELAEQLTTKLENFGTEVRDRVGDESVWRGAAARAAAQHTTEMHATMKAWAPKVAEVGSALLGAATDIDTHQRALQRVISEIQGRRGDGFGIDDSGKVIWPAGKEQVGRGYLTEITEILGRAAAADSDAGRAIGQRLQRLRFLQRVVAEERGEERAEGRQAAQELQRYLRDGRQPPAELLRTLERNADDEYFAAAMTGQLGSKGVLDFPAMLGDVDGVSERSRDALMTSFAHLVGTATNGEGPDMPAEVRRDLVAAAGSTDLMGREDEYGAQGQGEEHLGYRKFWAMQRLLEYGGGNIGGDFLADVGEQVYNNREELADSSDLEEDEWSRTGGNPDPMMTVLDSLGNDGHASREFFSADPNGDGQPDRVQALMEEHPLHRADGEALSEALHSASTEFEQQDPDRDTDAYRKGAAVAAEYLHGAAEHERGWNGPLSDDVKRDLAGTMSFYYEDVNTALQGAGLGVGTHDGTEAFTSELGFKSGVVMEQTDAKTLLNTVWDDHESKMRILGAANIYAEENIQQKVDNWRWDGDFSYESPEQARNAGYGDYGANLGRLVDAVHSERVGEAEDQAALTGFAKSAMQIGLIGSGPGGFASAALGEVANVSFGELQSGPEQARDAYDAEINTVEQRSAATVAEMMLRRGEIDPTTLPDDVRSYWREETGSFQAPNDRTYAMRLSDWLEQAASGPAAGAQGEFLKRFQMQTGLTTR